jgi:hypothetical protein
VVIEPKKRRIAMDRSIHERGEHTMTLKARTREQRGLGKYDAPLKVQFQQGIDSFKRGVVINIFHKDTMQYREWERGFNRAYFDRLEKVKDREQQSTNRSTEMVGGEV